MDEYYWSLQYCFSIVLFKCIYSSLLRAPPIWSLPAVWPLQPFWICEKSWAAERGERERKWMIVGLVWQQAPLLLLRDTTHTLSVRAQQLDHCYSVCSCLLTPPWCLLSLSLLFHCHCPMFFPLVTFFSSHFVTWMNPGWTLFISKCMGAYSL